MCPGVGPALPLASSVLAMGTQRCVRVLARLPPVPLWFSAAMAVRVGTGAMCPGVGPALPLDSSVRTMGTQRCVRVLTWLPLYLVLFGDGVEGQRGNLPGCWQRRKAITQISAKSFLILVMFTHSFQITFFI